MIANCRDASTPHLTCDRGAVAVMSPSRGRERANRDLALRVEVVAEQVHERARRLRRSQA